MGGLQQTHREPLLISVLLLTVFVAMGFYIVAALQGARALRESDALERNALLAQVYAKVVVSDIRDSLRVIHSFEARFFQGKLSLSVSEREALMHYCEISPRLYQATVLSNQGECLFTTDPEFARSLTRHIPLRDLNKGEVPLLQSLDNIPTFFTPIPKKNPQGYLVTSFRPEGFSLWLLDFRVTGTQVFILQPDGNVVVSTSSETRWRHFPQNYTPLRYAQSKAPGAVITNHPFIQRAALVGYAPIAETPWYLLVVQKVEDAYSQESYPILNLTYSMAPFLILLPFAAWITLDRYHSQRRKIQEFAFRNERLQMSAQAKEELLANVSHDLKTPIASLQLSLTGLRNPELAQTPARLEEYAQLLERGLDELSSKVRNLLDMSRLENAVPTKQLPLVELGELVAEVLERMEPLLRTHPLEVNFPDEPLFCEADPISLGTVLMNLLENAVRYTPEGSPIHLLASGTEERLSVTVRDFGPGIPEAFQKQVFEKFYRVPGQRQHGTGLGLAICRTAVESAGGTLVLTAPEGGGAAFTMTLPRYIPTEEGR